MSTKSFVQNVNIVADNADMLEELNTNLPKESIETLLAYDYTLLLADLNKADSDVINVSDNMGTIQSVSANMESILAVNGEVDEARSILGSVQAEANTAIASVGTATENAIQAVNQTEDSVIQSVNTTKDLAILTVNQTRDEAVNTVGLEVDKAEQSAVNSEASAKRAEAAAEEAASKIGITDTIRPSSEAVDYLAPSEHAVALLGEEISSSIQKVWKGTQAEFDALPNKEDYFMSYVIDNNKMRSVYNGLQIVFNDYRDFIVLDGTKSDGSSFSQSFANEEDMKAWYTSNRTTITHLYLSDEKGLITNFKTLFANNEYLRFFDGSKMNIQNIANYENLHNMFRGSTNIEEIILKDWVFWANENVPFVDVESMFYDCTSLKRLVFTGDVYIGDAQFLCRNCSSLQYIDLSGLRAPSINGFDNAFVGCTSLVTAYAHTIDYANVFNATSGKPANVNFVVKP